MLTHLSSPKVIIFCNLDAQVDLGNTLQFSYILYSVFPSDNILSNTVHCQNQGMGIDAILSARLQIVLERLFRAYNILGSTILLLLQVRDTAIHWIRKED